MGGQWQWQLVAGLARRPLKVKGPAGFVRHFAPWGSVCNDACAPLLQQLLFMGFAAAVLTADSQDGCAIVDSALRKPSVGRVLL